MLSFAPSFDQHTKSTTTTSSGRMASSIQPVEMNTLPSSEQSSHIPIDEVEPSKTTDPLSLIPPSNDDTQTTLLANPPVDGAAPISSEANALQTPEPAHITTPSVITPASSEDIVLITLLLNTGSRHLFKIDTKYLARRSVTTTDPFEISVYTTKELIWKDWRDGNIVRKAVCEMTC